MHIEKTEVIKVLDKLPNSLKLVWEKCAVSNRENVHFEILIDCLNTISDLF